MQYNRPLSRREQVNRLCEGLHWYEIFTLFLDKEIEKSKDEKKELTSKDKCDKIGE